jgi:hypothetical protein
MLHKAGRQSTLYCAVAPYIAKRLLQLSINQETIPPRKKDGGSQLFEQSFTATSHKKRLLHPCRETRL